MEGWFLWGYDGSSIPLRCRARLEADGTVTPLVPVTPAIQAALDYGDHATYFTPDGEPVSGEPYSDALWR